MVFKIRFYPELLLFDNEDKAFIVVGVQVAHLNRRLLLLPDSLPLPVQQLDLYVRIWRERKSVHFKKELWRKNPRGVSRPWKCMMQAGSLMLKSSLLIRQAKKGDDEEKGSRYDEERVEGPHPF